MEQKNKIYYLVKTVVDCIVLASLLDLINI